MWLTSLHDILKKKTIRGAGLISGTSADGIDVAICDFSLENNSYKSHSLIAFDTFPYAQETKKTIQASHSLSVQQIAELDMRIGEEFANAITALSKDKKIDPQ